MELTEYINILSNLLKLRAYKAKGLIKRDLTLRKVTIILPLTLVLVLIRIRYGV